MKLLKIAAVDKPKSFDKFTEKDWTAANKLGVLEVPAQTALENVKLSKGLYRILPDTREVEIVLKGLSPVEEMDGQALYAEMASHGKPPRKQMNMEKARAFVSELREKAAAMITDE